MYPTDKRILHLMNVLIFEKKISSYNEFYSDVGIFRQTISKINNGTSHFTVQHIDKICQKYKVNANWIFGLDKKVFNTPESIEIDL